MEDAKVKTAETRNLIYERLAPVLARYEFRLKRRDEAFVRPIAGGTQDVAIALVNYDPIFETGATLGVRLDEVQDLVNRFSDLDPRDQGTTLTLLTPLSFATGSDARYRASGEAELHRIADQMGEAIISFGVPFLERHKDVRSLDVALNVERVPGTNAIQLPYTAMRAVAIAYLAKNDDFDAIASDAVRDCLALRERRRQLLFDLLDFVRQRPPPGSV